MTIAADRAIVYREISSRFGSTRSFERLVQTELRHAVRRRLGHPWNVPSAWAAIIFMPSLWYFTFDTLSTQPDVQRVALGVRDSYDDPYRVFLGYTLINLGFYSFHALTAAAALKAALYVQHVASRGCGARRDSDRCWLFGRWLVAIFAFIAVSFVGLLVAYLVGVACSLIVLPKSAFEGNLVSGLF